MTNTRRYLGFILASPITLVGLLYVYFCVLQGWYKWDSVQGDALVWVIQPDKMPVWLVNAWKSWGGHTIGNVVVLKCVPADRQTTLKHEQKHVDQCMRLGILQPIIYGLSYFAIWFGCPGSHPYYDNCMEIDARRAAGQIIDVSGAVNQLKAKLQAQSVKDK